MTLTFPNPSRNFDARRDAMRFSGHDGMFEVVFYAAAAGLLKAASERRGAERSEAACLAAFDATRASVHDAARKAYGGGRQPYYLLTADDLP